MNTAQAIRSKSKKPPYTILRKLGQGTYGAAYLIEIEGRHAVMKVCHRHIHLDHVFVREARVMEHLDGAGGAPRMLFPVFNDESERMTLIMSYIDATTLWELINSKIKLTARDVARIILNVAQNLKEVHAKGVIHNDLKLDNVMVKCEETDSGGQLYKTSLIDFGLAKFSGERMRLKGKYFPNSHYAPELYVGVECVPSSDVFSLGVMLLDMLSICQRKCKTLYKDLQAAFLTALLKMLAGDMKYYSASERPTLDKVIASLQDLIDGDSDQKESPEHCEYVADGRRKRRRVDTERETKEEKKRRRKEETKIRNKRLREETEKETEKDTKGGNKRRREETEKETKGKNKRLREETEKKGTEEKRQGGKRQKERQSR